MNQHHGRLPLGLLGLTMLDEACRAEGEHDRDGGGKRGQQQFFHHAATSEFAPELGHLEFYVHFFAVIITQYRWALGNRNRPIGSSTDLLQSYEKTRAEQKESHSFFMPSASKFATLVAKQRKVERKAKFI